jgi:hypothetical protein
MSRRRSDRFRASLEDRAVDAVSDAAGQALEPKPKYGGMREQRIEWITWGVSIIVLGLCLTIFSGDLGPLSGKNDALWFWFPLISGGLMLGSAFAQKIINNWNVSFVTWGLGIILSALAVERIVAIWITQDRLFRFINYIGALIILTGLTIVLQIFRRQ